MKAEHVANVLSNTYAGQYSINTDYYIETETYDLMDDILKPFVGKKVKITIEEVEE